MDIYGLRIATVLKSRADGSVKVYKPGKEFYAPNIPKTLLNEMRERTGTVIEINRPAPPPPPPEDPVEDEPQKAALQKEVDDLEKKKAELEKGTSAKTENPEKDEKPKNTKKKILAKARPSLKKRGE